MNRYGLIISRIWRHAALCCGLAIGQDGCPKQSVWESRCSSVRTRLRYPKALVSLLLSIHCAQTSQGWVLDATRISDGAQTVLKIVRLNSPDIAISSFLAN